jgi:16S rRNA C1402 (ribose-2'-O) methylase RsmI
MLEALANQCQAQSLICVATDLTLPTESIQTRTAAEWKKRLSAGQALISIKNRPYSCSLPVNCERPIYFLNLR